MDEPTDVAVVDADSFGHGGQVLRGEGHPAVIERDQVSRHLLAPCPGGLYRPQNYDGEFKGLVSVRTALASSLSGSACDPIRRIFVQITMQRNGVIVRPLKPYGLPEWVRITVGTAAQTIGAAMQSAFRTAAGLASDVYVGKVSSAGARVVEGSRAAVDRRYRRAAQVAALRSATA